MQRNLTFTKMQILPKSSLILAKKCSCLKFFTMLMLCISFQLISSDILASTTEKREISGTIIDDEGPLVGATVQIKGTDRGTATDFDGNFTLMVEDTDETLIISYAGYETKEITLGSQSVFEISLATNNQILEEVVVVGYTTRKKGELTGSVSTINSEDIQKTTNKDVAKSLAGKVPGLIVADRGGYPGGTGDITLLIRGKSTLGNNEPLILIDGIPAASFSHLSPQDIESLSILKDGAAAIYGARAANGVILITTKRGKSGSPVVSLSSSYSRSNFSSDTKLMNSEQFAIYRNEAAERNGLAPRFTQEEVAKYAAGNDPSFPSTDWFDLTFADFSPEWRNTISVSGGSDNVKYFVSGDHIDQIGLFASGDLKFKQYQVRSNVDINVTNNFKIGLDLNGRFGDTNEPGVNEGFIYKHIYTNEPTEVAQYDNGLFARGGENGANPLIMSSNRAGFVNRKSNNLRAKVSFDWGLDWLTEGLSVQGYAGLRNWNTDTKDWYTPWTVYTFQEGTNEYIPQLGFSQQGTQNTLRETFWKFNELMLNATIHYNKTIGDHTLRGFVGTEQFTSETRSFWAERRGFPSNNVPELFAGADDGQISNGGSSEFARLNYFGSVSYDFKKKYFVDLTLRHDGSGNFGPGNRFGTFPGAAVAWAVNKENFMNGTSGWLDALKIRASWAIMGNDRIPPFQYLTRYNFGGPTDTANPNYYTFGTNGTRYNGYASSTVPNPDITWETADMKNIGLNFALFDFKLTGDLNYFYQKREDILITRNASIPDVAGLQLPQENLGKVDNFGWEAQIGWKDKVGKIGYSLGANITNARNEVVFLDEAVDVPDRLKREGFPIDSYIVYPTDGIFQNQEQVDATEVKLNGTVPGEPIYLDTNGDGVINGADRVRTFSSNVPQIQYGVLGGLTYGQFDFSFLLQGQAKAEMLVFFDDGGSLPEYVFNERWTPTNTGGKYPRAFDPGDAYSGTQNTVDNFQGADFWIHDASFLRIKEVELGFSLPKDKIKIGDLRVFFRGLNLATMFSEVHDLGLDPEANGYNNFRNSTYPSLKSYSFGLNINFR